MDLNYVNLNEAQFEVITNVLDKYCVNYKTKENKNILEIIDTYNIIVPNLKAEAYLFLTEKVEEKLVLIEDLENNLQLEFNNRDQINQSNKSTKKLETWLKAYFSDLEKKGIVKKNPPKPFKNLIQSINSIFKEDREIMNFDDLPSYAKEILLERFPLSILKSEKVVIKKDDMGFSIYFE